MTNQKNLPVITTTKDMALPEDESGSLVARGLEAIINRQSVLPLQSYYQPSGSELPEEYEKLKNAAEQGNAEAQFCLGESYYDHDDNAGSIIEAIKWWRKAAEQGSAAAHYNLGYAFGNINRLPKDFVQAYMWFYLACWSGGKPSRFYNPSPEQQIDHIKNFISSEQLVEARRLAVEYAKNYMTSEEITKAIAEAEEYERGCNEDDAS